MKKKIVALLAAIAAVFGFGFASNAALADEYGLTGSISGNTVTLSAPAGTFAPNETLEITVDDTYVSNVTFAANKTYTGKAHADGSATITLTLTDAALAKGYTATYTVKGKDSGKTYTASVTAPAAKQPVATTETPKTADTGAAVAPYAVAVALLAAAGVAVFAVRKTNAR
ncbi:MULTISPECIES: hypothetical protein [Bifidobacterium]|uniref:hypothetical protein n=1 Tax=Bifidobacterium TaxID=1678 RepID=UPI001BDC1A45|nr:MULTISPECIES: hypothetical protein [Bifidobacterium]MBT1160992.1 hypothetical protein [Bifidobacterium sp. SO1]MBW3079522.1 hypothetical protein [Bifidobacterium simiiventris]